MQNVFTFVFIGYYPLSNKPNTNIVRYRRIMDWINFNTNTLIDTPLQRFTVVRRLNIIQYMPAQPTSLDLT